SFAGVVRNHDGGRSVAALHYEGHPTAKDVLRAVVAEVAARHPQMKAVAVSHRVGDLSIGDVALACAVSAAHRREAFAACADLVSKAKARRLILKHQQFSDGTDEWVNPPEGAAGFPDGSGRLGLWPARLSAVLVDSARGAPASSTGFGDSPRGRRAAARRALDRA